MPRTPFLHRSILAALTVAVFALAGGAAWAQATSCEEIAPLLNERKSLIEQISSWGKKGKKVDPRTACATGRKLVSNGEKALKWLAANKEWCNIPGDFVSNFENDQKQVIGFRNGACNAATQMEKAEKGAREGGGLLGGGGLSGQYRIPQGAL